MSLCWLKHYDTRIRHFTQGTLPTRSNTDKGMGYGKIWIQCSQILWEKVKLVETMDFVQNILIAFIWFCCNLKGKKNLNPFLHLVKGRWKRRRRKKKEKQSYLCSRVAIVIASTAISAGHSYPPPPLLAAHVVLFLPSFLPFFLLFLFFCLSLERERRLRKRMSQNRGTLLGKGLLLKVMRGLGLGWP